jgi:CBS domain-containing membrane protein
MINVEELMTANPHTLREEDTLFDAWKIMSEHQIRHIPITGEDGHLKGLVTQRDVLAATNPSSSGKAGDIEVPLSDIMIRNISVIHPSDHLRQAALHMQSHRHGCLPVVADEKLVGIITDSDFISIAINLLEQVELLEDQEDDYDLDDNELDDSELETETL